MATPHPKSPKLEYESEDGEDEEILDDDAINLIDSVADLAVLRSEFEEVRKTVSLRRNKGHYHPMKIFRNSGSVSVSDVSSGLWCELQVEYRHLHPFLQRTKEWQRMKSEGRPIEKRTAIMQTGTDMHFKKEVEVHGIPVKIVTKTKEDQWAIELMNTYIKLALVKEGNIGAEIKVFGMFSDTVLCGVVDQIQYCVNEKSLILLELKTRRSESMPGGEQKRSHYLQLMLYKILFDSLCQGKCDYCRIVQKLGLQLTTVLSSECVEYMREKGLLLLGGYLEDSVDINALVITFEDLIDLITNLVKGLQLPVVDTLLLQYVFQGSDSVLGVEQVIYDEEWTKKELQNSLGYWLGERKAVGVDIEDSWKCQTCQFSEVCIWRKNQILQSSPVKKWPSVFFE